MFYLCFIYSTSYGLKMISLHTHVYLFQHCLLKRLFFLCWTAFALLLKINHPYMWGSVWWFSILFQWSFVYVCTENTLPWLLSLLISEVIRSSSRFILRFQNCSKYFKYFAFWYELEHQFVRKPWCVALADFHGANTPTWPVASYSSAVTERGAGKQQPCGSSEPAHPGCRSPHTAPPSLAPYPQQMRGPRRLIVLAGASAATRRGEGSTTAMGWLCSQGSWPQWLPLRQPRWAPGEAISPSVPVSG